MMERTVSALAALAASCTPALAHVAPWSSPDPPPLAVQFLVGIALMAVAGAVVLWHGAALAREALASERKRRRASQDLRVYKKAGTRRSAPLWLASSMRSAGGRRVSAPTAGGRPSASWQCADSSRAARFQGTVVSVG
jgi:hypothetical protein